MGPDIPRLGSSYASVSFYFLHDASGENSLTLPKHAFDILVAGYLVLGNQVSIPFDITSVGTSYQRVKGRGARTTRGNADVLKKLLSPFFSSYASVSFYFLHDASGEKSLTLPKHASDILVLLGKSGQHSI
jgi:hypothetical protein